MIDITMTATLRIKIIEETLKSFCENMLTDRNRYRLIINIDPIGNDAISSVDIMNLLKNYFDDISCNFSTSPGFTQAVIWTWNQIESDYVFNLQDDWKLLRPINIDYMIEILENNPKLAGLRLNKEETIANEDETDFTYCPRISLNPTLFKSEFIKGVTPLMTANENPEKQLRPSLKSERGRFIRQWNNGIYIKESRKRIVDDIGRIWMKNSNYKKETGFLKWETK